jgi:hypothetical protein
VLGKGKHLLRRDGPWTGVVLGVSSSTDKSTGREDI